MKYIITALLSAALLLLIGNSGIKNSETKAAHTTRAEQRVKAQEPEVSLAKAETPQTQPLESQPEVPVEIPVQTPPPTDHEQLMNQAGIQPEDYGAADFIITHESSWREFAQEPNSGAFGLCQSLPAIKMASAGSDWQTNPVTQLKWCNSYAVTRYGGWQGAYTHWTQFRWW